MVRCAKVDCAETTISTPQPAVAMVRQVTHTCRGPSPEKELVPWMVQFLRTLLARKDGENEGSLI